MRRFPNSDDDRLFSGDLDPDDAPPELAHIAGLIQAAKTPGIAEELAGEELIVSQMAAVVRESRRTEAAHNDRRHVLAKMLSAKVIGASAAVLLSGGIAAAATGALPTPVQEAVSHGLAHVGISVPDPAAHPSSAHSSASRSATHVAAPTGASGVTHSTTTANRYGLCTAYEHASNTKARANGLAKVTAAAQAKSETVTQYCAGAAPPENSTSTTIATNPGSTHRPTKTSSSNPGRGAQHRSSTTVPVRHSGAQGPTGATNGKASKSAANPSIPPKSRGKSSTSTTVPSSTTTTSTTLPANGQGHSSANNTVGKEVSSAHTP